MKNTDEYLDWFSLENIDSKDINFNDVDEKEWFDSNNIDFLEDKYFEKDNVLDSITWNLSIRFKSITLQNPATIIFKSSNWYKIIKGPNDTPTSKCPKTNPPIPCKRSTTLFNNFDIEMSTKFVCTWKEIFDRLSLEPLKIESYKISPFGDQELHSEGYINLKHILIQPEKKNPTISNSSIYGANTYRIWPTRVLLYPVGNSNINTSSDEVFKNKDKLLLNDQNDKKEFNYMNSHKNTPLGLLEVDVIIQDCQRQSISDNSPIIKKKGYKANDHNLSSKSNSKILNSPVKDKINSNKNKLKSLSPKKNFKNLENNDYDIEKFLNNNNNNNDDNNVISLQNLFNNIENDYEDNNSNFDYLNQINESNYKFDYFTVKDEINAKHFVDNVVNEIDFNKDYQEIDELRKAEEYVNSFDIQMWKKTEKEKFIKHIYQLEEEFRKITLIRQETIMKEFINDINRKNQKLAKLENLITNKIFKLKNKENQVENINHENNRKIQIIKYEYQKLLETQKNEYLAKLELEKKKIHMVELEKNKWLKKFNNEEEANNKLINELKNIRANRKSDEYYKNELARKEEIIQSYQMQVTQLKENIELLKASRDHIKTQLDCLVASINLPNNSSISNNINEAEYSYNHDINALLKSGLYNEDDKFIQHLKPST